MKITVETVSGTRSIHLQVDPTDSILDVKLKIRAAWGAPLEQQHLRCNRLQLENDGQSLQDYNIGYLSLLTLVLRLAGSTTTTTTSSRRERCRICKVRTIALDPKNGLCVLCNHNNNLLKEKDKTSSSADGVQGENNNKTTVVSPIGVSSHAYPCHRRRRPKDEIRKKGISVEDRFNWIRRNEPDHLDKLTQASSEISPVPPPPPEPHMTTRRGRFSKQLSSWKEPSPTLTIPGVEPFKPLGRIRLPSRGPKDEKRDPIEDEKEHSSGSRCIDWMRHLDPKPSKPLEEPTLADTTPFVTIPFKRLLPSRKPPDTIKNKKDAFVDNIDWLRDHSSSSSLSSPRQEEDEDEDEAELAPVPLANISFVPMLPPCPSKEAKKIRMEMKQALSWLRQEGKTKKKYEMEELEKERSVGEGLVWKKCCGYFDWKACREKQEKVKTTTITCKARRRRRNRQQEVMMTMYRTKIMAAVMIQSTVRGFLLRKSISSSSVKVQYDNRAATKLQSAVRGFLAYRKFTSIQKTRNRGNQTSIKTSTSTKKTQKGNGMPINTSIQRGPKREKRAMNKAAIKIQAIVRVFLDQKKQKRRQKQQKLLGGNFSPKKRASKELSLMGVSVDWLERGLLQEAYAAGLSHKSTLHDLEDLQIKSSSLIRRKGANIECPIDGRLGASYVHSLGKDKDRVGRSQYILSYSWSYCIGDIVDTLLDFCASHNLNPKRTYIWIDCLCINQHRVVEQKEIGGTGLLNFEQEFPITLTSIGHMLAMMAPWHAPLYLTRVWCIFEVFTAHTKDVDVTIIMPPREKQEMTKAIGLKGKEGIDQLYRTLGNTRVEDAVATHATDRKNILTMIENGPGFRQLNLQVNDLLRTWVKDTILLQVHKLKSNQEIKEKQPNTVLSKTAAGGGSEKRGSLKLTDITTSEHAFALFVSNVGVLFQTNNEYTHALECHRLALDTYMALDDQEGTATAHSNMGLTLQSYCDYAGAQEHFQKALDLQKTTLGMNHGETASTLSNIASVMLEQGNHSAALIHSHQAVSIQESILGPDHPQLAMSHTIEGRVLFGLGMYEKALEKGRKALGICEQSLGLYHPDTALCYQDIGLVLLHMGGQEDFALEHFENCVAISESVLGSDHPATVEAHQCVYCAFDKLTEKQPRSSHSDLSESTAATFDMNASESTADHWLLDSLPGIEEEEAEYLSRLEAAL